MLQKSLYFRPGKYIVTSQNALMSSPTSGTAAVLRNGLIHGGQGTEGAEIIFASTVSAATVADKSQGNLITAANRLHGFKIDNLKLRSLNANQTFAYLWCSVTNDGGQFPGFGSGSQRRIQWTNLDFKGDWRWGIALDGDTAANLNSEQYLANIYISDTTTFSVAFFHSGVTDPATNAQQDQFVNYIIENCILEYANGSAFKFDRGGHITCIGGSFVGGVGGSGTVKFFDFSRGGGNYWKCHLAVIGTRFEMRTATSRVLYSGVARPDRSRLLRELRDVCQRRPRHDRGDDPVHRDRQHLDDLGRTRQLPLRQLRDPRLHPVLRQLDAELRSHRLRPVQLHAQQERRDLDGGCRYWLHPVRRVLRPQVPLPRLLEHHRRCQLGVQALP